MQQWMVLWLIFSVAVCGVVSAVALVLVRRHGGTPARETGVTVQPVPSATPDHPWRRVGGAVLPGPLGKVNASWPLGLMEGNDAWVEIRIRPVWLARLFGARPLRASTSSTVEVFPARGFWGLPFVGLRVGEREGYFACSGREELLGHLQACGYRVSVTERKIIFLG